MGRRPNPQRKQDLLGEIVAYLGEHGIGDLSLRPLAKRLGTSTYTLTYQFGSKGQLLADAVRHALLLEVQGVTELAAGVDRNVPSDLVRRMWEWSTDRENLRLVRMLLEATTLAYSQPEVFGGVGQQIIAEGIALLRRAMVDDGIGEAMAQRLATQAYATLVGLQVDLIATGDRERVNRALDELCRSLDEAVEAGEVVAPGTRTEAGVEAGGTQAGGTVESGARPEPALATEPGGAAGSGSGVAGGAAGGEVVAGGAPAPDALAGGTPAAATPGAGPRRAARASTVGS
jgi:AcrR family transcriptional regulator